MPADGFRVEHDSMGEVQVPADALWRAQTQRAVENFPVSGRRIDPAVIHALAAIKGRAATVNAGLGAIDAERAAAIETAAAAVEAGEWDDHFPIDVFQTGSGTSTNMNVNEVIASLASTDDLSVHPNDHVNAGQSSNDTFPSAVHVAAMQLATTELVPALGHLAGALRTKADEYAGAVKPGRTHLMDAVPVTVGQEFDGYAAQMTEAIERVESTLPRVGRLALGGTATGTGLNATPGFASAVIDGLAARLNLPLVEAPDHFAAQGARDALVELSGQLRATAVGLIKIANDLRWAASGPTSGLAELHLPDLQPGSSIMPGKVNPVIPEVVTQVGAQVLGNDVTVGFAGSQGAFELNVFIPVIAHNVMESIRLLTAACTLLADRCVAGIVVDVERCRRLAESSPAIATALNPLIGYERAAEVVKEAMKTGRTIREIVLDRGWITAEQADQMLDVQAMTEGGLR